MKKLALSPIVKFRSWLLVPSIHSKKWEKSKTVTDFIFLGSKITVDGDYSHEIKRQLLLERKAVAKLDSILKSRDINSATNAHIFKSMIFPVVIYGCENWTIKAECRTDAFELWCWRRLLKSSGHQGDQTSLLKEINSTFCLEYWIFEYWVLP